MHPYWVRSIREQCLGAGVPFMFKQWGEWTPTPKAGVKTCLVLPDGRTDYSDFENFTKRRNGWERFGDDASMMFRVGKKRAGRLLDGREWNQTPFVEKGVNHEES